MIGLRQEVIHSESFGLVNQYCPGGSDSGTFDGGVYLTI